jgi:hypothetical protein
MRIVIVLLAGYISFLVFSPAVCGIDTMLKQFDSKSCCNGEKSDPCSKKNTSSNKQTDCNTSCTPCYFMQNCPCYFVSDTQLKLQPDFYTAAQKTTFTADKIFSTFLSDCWRPPEVA